jgi:PII-like signaling protein
MLKAGPAKKVIIYVGEEQKYHGASAYSAILDFLFYHGVSGATVLRGLAGFGADHHIHSDRILAVATNLPMKVEFVESAEKVEEILPKLFEMAGTGLIEIQETTVAKPAATGKKSRERAIESHALRSEGTAKIMRIFVGESDRWHDKPLYRAILECLRANDIAGGTVYKGILGYGANKRVHKGSTMLSHDAPMMITVVDTEEKLRKLTPTLDEMVQQGGLVVMSDVDVIKYTRDYTPTGDDRRKEARA